MKGSVNIDILSGKVLKTYNKRGQLNLTQLEVILDDDFVLDAVHNLYKSGYIEPIPLEKTWENFAVSYDTIFRITFEGKNKLEELRRESKERMYKILIDWFHIILTTIAVAVSIIGIIIQRLS